MRHDFLDGLLSDMSVDVLVLMSKIDSEGRIAAKSEGFVHADAVYGN